jgi:hypothetical protein
MLELWWHSHMRRHICDYSGVQNSLFLSITSADWSLLPYASVGFIFLSDVKWRLLPFFPSLMHTLLVPHLHKSRLRLSDIYQCFGGTYFLHLQGWYEESIIKYKFRTVSYSGNTSISYTVQHFRYNWSGLVLTSPAQASPGRIWQESQGQQIIEQAKTDNGRSGKDTLSQFVIHTIYTDDQPFPGCLENYKCIWQNDNPKISALGNYDTKWRWMALFWVVAPRSLVEVYHRFRGTCCLHHQGHE